MYAIVETGGKQYRVEPNWTVMVEKLPGEPGQEITLDKVLMTGGDDRKIGSPYVEGASVKAEVLKQARQAKVIVFKRRRRKDSKSKHGHRQYCTMLRIKEIVTA